jgi:hypothetical protein
MKKIPVHTYITVFLLTAAIIVTALYGSIYLNRIKTETINETESKIAIDIFALETKIDLLKESECKTVIDSSVTKELTDLHHRLSFMEEQLGVQDAEIFRLKRYYGLLEIKDYLITEKLNERCKLNTPTIIYFYDVANTCEQCLEQEYVIEALRQQRKDIHIYSLDHVHDMPALLAYTTMKDLPDTLPLLIINNKTHKGFRSVEDIETAIASSTATTTSKSIKN